MDTHEETLNKLKGAMKVGGKYTCFHIDSMMAMTHKAEIQVKEINPEHFVFVARGKRKLLMKRWESRSYQSAPLEPIDWAIFEGWDQPITCDTDRYGQGSVSIMRGNACYNFMGTPEQVRAWIEAGQLNPFFETYKALAIEGQLETVVFPEHVITGNHAVIDRLMTDNPEVTV